MEQMEYVKNQCFQSICRNETMMCTKDTALIVAPSFDQNNAAFEEMVFSNKPINLLKSIIKKEYMKQEKPGTIWGATSA